MMGLIFYLSVFEMGRSTNSIAWKLKLLAKFSTSSHEIQKTLIKQQIMMLSQWTLHMLKKIKNLGEQALGGEANNRLLYK